MNQAKKQRLVGAVVLVSLALILVPLVLDFSRQETVPRGDVVVPPAPDSSKMQILPLNVWSKKIDPQVKPEPIVVEESAMVELSDAAVQPLAAKGEQDRSEAPAITSESTQEVEEKALPRPDVDATVDVVAPNVSLKGKAWMVQMGSFSTEEKAFVFRDRLRDLGYAAYIVPGESQAGRRFFRVRVGPEILHSKAESIRQQLKEETGLDGLVMRFR